MNDTTEQSTPAAPAGPSTPPRPPLVRSRSDRKVAGVAGGIAAYLGIDPLILRIVIVVLTVFGGSGLLLYAAGWLLIPDEGEQHSEIERLVGRDRTHGPSVGAIIVTVVGLIILVTSLSVGAAFGHDWWLGGPDLWPLIVVGAIVALVWYARRDQPTATGPAPYVPTATYVPTEPTVSTVPSAPTAREAPTLVDIPVAPAAGAAAAAAASGGAGAPPTYHWTPTPPPPVPQAPPAPRRQRSILGALTWWVALVAAGTMWLLDRGGVWDVRPVTFCAVLLAIVGAGLVVGAFVGRSRGLIAMGVLLSVTTAVVGAVPAVGHGRTGTVAWTPTSVSAVPVDGYEWAAGKATLDLSATTVDSAREVHVQLGAGRLLVIVPAGARVVLDETVGVGSLRGPDGRQDDGFGAQLDGVYGNPSGPTLVLRLELGVGSMEVRYAQA